MSEPIDKKIRNKDREKYLRELRLTPKYYIGKTMFAITAGGLIGFGHWWLTSKSTLPDWISILAALVVSAGYFSISHLLTLKQVSDDVKKWNRWSDSDI